MGIPCPSVSRGRLRVRCVMVALLTVGAMRVYSDLGLRPLGRSQRSSASMVTARGGWDSERSSREPRRAPDGCREHTVKNRSSPRRRLLDK